MNRVLLTKVFCGTLIIAGLNGCDVFQKDASPTDVQTVALYLPPNKSAVIDVGQVIPDFSTISVNETAAIKFLGGRYVGYSAGNKNTDNFTFNVDRKSGGKSVVNVSVAPQSATNDACDKNGAFTYARIVKNSKLVVNLLNNYEFCGYTKLPGQFSATRCESADVMISIYSAPTTFTAICTYSPPKDFVGQIRFKYYLGMASKNLGSLVGLPGIGDPGMYQYYSEHDAVIDVVEQ